jgi:chemotaxis response regulator CheB
MDKIKVLVVDDSALVRQTLVSILESDPQIEIVGVAADPYIAVEKIKECVPDVITLDIEMPVMDGFKVLEIVSKLPTKPKIIVFTSLDNRGADNAMKALHLGADDFVTKIEGTVDVNKNIKEGGPFAAIIDMFTDGAILQMNVNGASITFQGDEAEEVYKILLSQKEVL